MMQIKLKNKMEHHPRINKSIYQFLQKANCSINFVWSDVFWNVIDTAFEVGTENPKCAKEQAVTGQSRTTFTKRYIEKIKEDHNEKLKKYSNQDVSLIRDAGLEGATNVLNMLICSFRISGSFRQNIPPHFMIFRIHT